MTDHPAPPVAAHSDTVIVRHGERHSDPYAWLRDDNWQQVMRDPAILRADIRDYLEAENTYTAAIMAPTEALQQSLAAEMRGRIKAEDSSVPRPDGPWDYTTRFTENAEYPLYCRSKRNQPETEQVLFDSHSASLQYPFFRVTGMAHSPDHRHLAVATDISGSEYSRIRILDMNNGEWLPDEIGSTQGDLVWSADSMTLFYTWLDDNHRPAEVRRHAIGQTGGACVVYAESDSAFYLGVDKTESGCLIVINAHDHTTSELHLVPANAPDSAPHCFRRREQDRDYDLSDHGETLFLLTNIAADGILAEDYRIVTTDLGGADPGHWTEVVPHRPGVLILSMIVFCDWLVRHEREDGMPRIVVRHITSGEEHTIAMSEDVFDLAPHQGYEFAADTLRFVFSSPRTPTKTFDYDMAQRTRTLRKTQEVPSGHDPAHYQTLRLMVPAHDGELVPVSLLWHRDTPLDGSAPLLLYGYGAYGITIPMAFTTNRFSLVDRGFIYAHAHIRGGKDRGYRWYREGKMAHKMNTFHDFIAAAEGLISEGLVRKGRIAIHGGSAGGLLVGAAINMAPDLFHACVAEVPFVDVMNTMCDASLPLTPPEWKEWGNPIEDAEHYRRILDYSPYDNVRPQAYPHVLATGGLSDPRVTYWEPAKWAARLRALRTDDRLTLLKTNMEAGHGGSAGRFDKLSEVALVYAFLFKVFDRTP